MDEREPLWYRFKLRPSDLEPGIEAERWIFGKADLGSAERNRFVATLHLILLIQQVLILSGGEGCRGLHRGGQNCRISSKLGSGRSLCAGGVGRGLTVTQSLSVCPGSRLRPENVAACTWRWPRSHHKVQGFGAFWSAAAPGRWRKNQVRIWEPKDPWTVFFQTAEAASCCGSRTTKTL